MSAMEGGASWKEKKRPKEKWMLNWVRCQRCAEDLVLSVSPEPRQKPAHNPTAVSYACFPVAVVSMGLSSEGGGGSWGGREDTGMKNKVRDPSRESTWTERMSEWMLKP